MLPSFKKTAQVRWLNCLTGKNGMAGDLSEAQPGCTVRVSQGPAGLVIEPGDRSSLLNGRPFRSPTPRDGGRDAADRGRPADRRAGR